MSTPQERSSSCHGFCKGIHEGYGCRKDASLWFSRKGIISTNLLAKTNGVFQLHIILLSRPHEFVILFQ